MKNLLPFFLLLALAAPLYGQGEWSQLQPMPQAAGLSAAATYDGAIYLLGGAPTITSATADVYRYDPATQTYTALPDLPQPRCGAAAVALGGKIYVIGGGTQPVGSSLATVFVFDPASQTWSTAADLPEPRSLHAAGVIDGKIYVAGGGTTGNLLLAGTVVYDPATNSWSAGPAMPTPAASSAGPWSATSCT